MRVLFALLLASCASAQWLLNPSLPSVRPDLTYAAAEKLLARSYDPSADKLLAAAQAYTSAIFRLPSLKFRQAATFRNDSGDQLIGQWTFDEPFANGLVILEDTPSYSHYHFRLPHYTLHTRADAGRLVANLVRMEKPGLNIDPARSDYVIFGDEGSPTGFSWGYVPLIPVQFGGDELRIFGVPARNGWNVTVTLGKRHVRGYPVPGFIPERFPPLEELSQGWSAAKILSEIGRKSNSGNVWERRTALLDELALREISAEEMQDILAHPANLMQSTDWSLWVSDTFAQATKRRPRHGPK
jgi:hypothetical protein